MLDEVALRLNKVWNELRACEEQFGRARASVALIAVSKRQSVPAVRAAYAAGQRAFGENYLQEALTKQAALSDCAIEWHYIGAIQGNKTAEIAQHFAWVHSVDRLRIAERLSTQRPLNLGLLNICIQVNISDEQSKSGVRPADLPALAEAVSALPQLCLRGLMTLPAPSHDLATQRAAFAELRALAQALNPKLDTLSMGTSEDFVAAIAEGSTMVRLGTAIFGPRPDSA
jgi:PLP dependent protein